jgi:hypothetical protein
MYLGSEQKCLTSDIIMCWHLFSHMSAMLSILTTAGMLLCYQIQIQQVSCFAVESKYSRCPALLSNPNTAGVLLCCQILMQQVSCLSVKSLYSRCPALPSDPITAGVLPVSQTLIKVLCFADPVIVSS